MFSESASYVLRVLCSYSLIFSETSSYMEAQKLKAEADLKAEAIRIDLERKQAVSKNYSGALVLKRKFEKNRDALIVLAP
jgi:hypothetical protein